MELKTIRAELHIHTVLSPCAEIEMLPPLIVTEALERGIQWLAITDHNATGNILAVQKAAEGTSLMVMPGMEVQTREEVHALCLFDTLDQALAWQSIVDQTLPSIENKVDFFGDQLLVDENGDYLQHENRLLSTSISLSLNEACEHVHTLGGVFIPAHVNRKAFGLLATLGFVPQDVQFEALEISRHIKPAEAPLKYPQIVGYPLIQSGDVHRLDEFLGVNQFTVAAPTILELRMALQGRDGRSMRILSHTVSDSLN